MAERTWALALFVAGVLGVQAAFAGPVVSLIIDDLGNRGDVVDSVVALPAAVALAVLPLRPHGPRVARSGAQAGHEIMLHLPLEAGGGEPLGPGGLTAADDRGTFVRRLNEHLDALPEAVGVNNHMGSRLTRDLAAMGWLMSELNRRGGLFFVDSRTTHETVAYHVATLYGLPSTERDLFLDNARETGAIREAFLAWVGEARINGSALAIAHPHAETLAVLAEMLPRLPELGVTLVPVGELIALRDAAGGKMNQAARP